MGCFGIGLPEVWREGLLGHQGVGGPRLKSMCLDKPLSSWPQSPRHRGEGGPLWQQWAWRLLIPQAAAKEGGLAGLRLQGEVPNLLPFKETQRRQKVNQTTSGGKTRDTGV